MASQFSLLSFLGGSSFPGCGLCLPPLPVSHYYFLSFMSFKDNYMVIYFFFQAKDMYSQHFTPYHICIDYLNRKFEI